MTFIAWPTNWRLRSTTCCQSSMRHNCSAFSRLRKAMLPLRQAAPSSQTPRFCAKRNCSEMRRLETCCCCVKFAVRLNRKVIIRCRKISSSTCWTNSSVKKSAFVKWKRQWPGAAMLSCSIMTRTDGDSYFPTPLRKPLPKKAVRAKVASEESASSGHFPRYCALLAVLHRHGDWRLWSCRTALCRQHRHLLVRQAYAGCSHLKFDRIAAGLRLLLSCSHGHCVYA